MFEIRLVESDELQKFLTSILIPAWLESCARWKSTIDKYLIRELEAPVLSRLRAEISPDLQRFLERHPQFEQVWPSTTVLLGS